MSDTDDHVIADALNVKIQLTSLCVIYTLETAGKSS